MHSRITERGNHFLKLIILNLNSCVVVLCDLTRFQWDNSTNSTNKTLLQAALIERSNLSEEQKKNVADSMKECITSDKVKGGKKNWRVRYNQNEKCGSLKSLVCAARSFFASVSEKLRKKNSLNIQISPKGMC